MIDKTASDNLDISNRISLAAKAFFSLSKQVFRNKLLDIKTRAMAYKTLVLNVLLWGCEAWALTQEQRRRLEVFHHRCLRRILNVTIYDVMEKHITNEKVEQDTTIPPFKNFLELLRCNWIQKIAEMPDSRTPRRLLGVWLQKSRCTGRPQQTIRHAYHLTICRTLGFSDSKFKSWFNIARSKVE